MARNAEKAMTALARWRKLKEDEEKGPSVKRPNDVNECHNVTHAEKFRRDIIKEVAKKITQIQNPGLGEYKIRDLNDEINKLLRLKSRWEDRIKELGGADWKKIAPKMLDREGREIPGAWGYKYFGAARDLPGVRELFEPAPVDTSHKTRAELMKHIDADYYGYLDDDDELLLPLEAEAERKAIDKAIAEWKAKKADQSGQTTTREDDDDKDIYAQEDEPFGPEATVTTAEKIGGGGAVTFDSRNAEPTHIEQPQVPTQQEVEAAIVRRKKIELLNKYAGVETIGAQAHQLNALLGFGETSAEKEKTIGQAMES